MTDRLARSLAAAALAVALVAVILAYQAMNVSRRYEESLDELGTTLRAMGKQEPLPLRPPPPTLETDDY